jgi:hypothetical protein
MAFSHIRLLLDINIASLIERSFLSHFLSALASTMQTLFSLARLYPLYALATSLAQVESTCLNGSVFRLLLFR